MSQIQFFLIALAIGMLVTWVVILVHQDEQNPGSQPR